MIRVIAVLAALALAPAALAQDATAASAAAPSGAQPPASSNETGVPGTASGGTADATDLAALQGKVEALGEQVAELKSASASASKLKLSGYVQGRWAWLEKGQPASAPPNAYSTSPETAISSNGFFVRRARVKAAYDADWSQYVLQLDATTRGVLVKEAFATLKLARNANLDFGLQLLPFGYEVSVRSSADLDLLERAMVTKYFIDGEYDIGASLRGTYGKLNYRIGVFNGNGVAAWGFASSSAGYDNDQRKDVIGRLGFDLGWLTGGVSGWRGKTIDYGTPDKKAHDRIRYGGDLQAYLDLLPVGGTAIKGEYIWGRTGIGTANDGAGTNLGKTASGWYVLGTQNLGPWNQLAARYEQLITNHTANVGPTSTTVKVQKAVEVAFHTFIGGGYKLSAAWFHPMSGARGGAAVSDPKADQFIVQAQAKF